MKQSDIFLSGEGAAWAARNVDCMGKDDPVTPALVDAGIRPRRVLEVGCGNGWRLVKLFEMFECAVFGIDPGAEKGSWIGRGQAADLGWWDDGFFDLVIFGFCLYLVDPQDYFKAVSEADRVLADGGHLVIHDFPKPERPWRTPYKHREGVFSHHVHFPDLWLSHPAYKVISENPDGSVTMLHKNLRTAFEERKP